MRLPDSAHRSRPWRIHELAPEFRLEDVWELPWRGGPEDFPHLVAMIAGGDPARNSSRAVRGLFAVRNALGRWLRFDDPYPGAATSPSSLRERLPADLRNTPTPVFAIPALHSLYLLEDEFAAEGANRTMHGVLHLGRVPDAGGGFRAQFAVLVKPNGLLGKTYMAAIKPFRRLIVYPNLFRQWDRAWQRKYGQQPWPPG
jgi:hypothetical protein